jgi:hypothetical protein
MRLTPLLPLMVLLIPQETLLVQLKMEDSLKMLDLTANAKME